MVQPFFHIYPGYSAGLFFFSIGDQNGGIPPRSRQTAFFSGRARIWHSHFPAQGHSPVIAIRGARGFAVQYRPQFEVTIANRQTDHLMGVAPSARGRRISSVSKLGRLYPDLGADRPHIAARASMDVPSSHRPNLACGLSSCLPGRRKRFDLQQFGRDRRVGPRPGHNQPTDLSSSAKPVAVLFTPRKSSILVARHGIRVGSFLTITGQRFSRNLGRSHGSKVPHAGFAGVVTDPLLVQGTASMANSFAFQTVRS